MQEFGESLTLIQQQYSHK